MKLITRIMLICSMAVITAILLSDGIILKYYSNMMNEKAIRSTVLEFEDIIDEYKKNIESANINIEASDFSTYYFKMLKDDYIVCVDTKNNVELFNHTVFTYDELKEYFHKGNRQAVVETDDNKKMEFLQLQWEGKYLIVYKTDYDDMVIYKIFDITYIKEELIEIKTIMLIVFVVIVIFIGILMWLLLKRAFLPLQELSQNATLIASGDYSKRANIIRMDEIGELGEKFNIMATAVEEKIEQLIEEKDKKNIFMGNLTHELRTPLTAIYGYAQMLRSIDLSEEDKESALEYIEKESLRVSRISNKMMSLMGIKEGNDIEKKNVAIEELFSNAENGCKKQLREKKINLVKNVNDEYLTADKDLLTEVIINLLENAIRASKDGSDIKLYVSDTNPKQIIVEDEGVGMPEEEIVKITEPFYRIDKSRSRKEGGAGLGLALVKEILIRHDMELRIESTEGAGTKVIIIYE